MYGIKGSMIYSSVAISGFYLVGGGGGGGGASPKKSKFSPQKI